MNDCKLLTNGRKRVCVDVGRDVVGDIDQTMQALINMKNNEGHSWRSLANELGGKRAGIYGSLVREVALGKCKSPRINEALGIGPALREYDKRYQHVCRNPSPKSPDDLYKFAARLPGECRQRVKATGMTNTELVLWALDKMESEKW